MSCIFSIEDPTQLADSPLTIIIDHLPLLTEVRLVLELEDYYCINAPQNLAKSVKWQSSAVFLTDHHGRLDVTQSPALKGDYTGVNAMGLFETARPQKTTRVRPEKTFEAIALNDHFSCRLSVFQGRKKLGQYSFKRYYLQKGWSVETVSLQYAKARLFYQENWRNRPAVIVLSGSEGGLEKAQNIAQLLSSRGFVAMAVAYFGLEDLPSDLNAISLEVIEEALHYLAGLAMVDEERIGIYGRSKGAEFALLAACHFSKLKAAVLNSPTDCVYEGLKGRRNAGCSSWTYQGREIPYTAFQWRHFLSSYVLGRNCLVKNPASLLPVESIKASVLLIASSHDEVWDSYSAAIDLMTKMQSAKPLRLLITPHLGHMNTISYQPNLRYKNTSPFLIHEDTRMSWQATIKHFEEAL
ncbi:acyl-CoA thioesterase/BAAT N-terminal domain-containing protein [Streptococcus dentiloxodontae]